MNLHIFEENSKYGYRDENETIVIPAKYEEAKEFKDDFAIVKHNGLYGVVNSSDATIIDFTYSAIEEYYFFFECKTIQENEHEFQAHWYNSNGIMLHEGIAKALSEKFLCILNGKKFGVISQEGNRIINCLYDEIVLKNELLIVRRGDLLGLYDLSGNVIFDAFCKSIESVVIYNNPEILGPPTIKNKNGYYYLGYNKEYYFDADIRMNAPHGDNYYNFSSHYLENYGHRGEYVDRLYRKKVKTNGKKTIPYISESEEWDLNKPFIISVEKSKMLYLKSEGILCEFDDIQQITQICYVVKKDNLYGVFRVDSKSLIIPTEFDNIRFYGGHTVLLYKDNLWGARSLVLDNNTFFKLMYNVSISIEYLEIKILDDYQQFFGCKKKRTYYSDEYYTIVRSNGEEVGKLKCDSQFVSVDNMHFLTSIGGKFGFVNSQAQKINPFK